MSTEKTLLEFESGCSGKAQVLIQAILEVIYQDNFGDMTVAEVLGVLELIKLNLMLERTRLD